MLAADFLAPHDFAKQHRRFPLAPPTSLHFVDAEGLFHLRPFVYGLTERTDAAGDIVFGDYVEETSERFDLRFFVVGETPRRIGPFELRHRLVGVEEGGALFLLGTDRFGRDQLSRLLYGGRISLFAGLLAGLLAVGLGLLLGAAAGYHGAFLDELLMRGGELVLALPWFYLLIAVRAVLPLTIDPTATMLLIVSVIGLVGWVTPARLVRGVVMSAKERDYVRVARGFGASELDLLRHHILPRTAGVALTQLAILVPRFIVAEATLSFLGLGVAEPVPSWGGMLAVLQQVHILASSWWMSVPAVALIGVVLSYHQLASALERQLSASAP